MPEPLRIGGSPIVSLRAELPAGAPGFISADIAPGRGFLLLRADLRLSSGELVPGIAGPTAEEAAQILDGGPHDAFGNKSFSLGGAILAPYANRIRGRELADARAIEAQIEDRSFRLPRNWGGKAPGAAQYAMHGLILETPVAVERAGPDRVEGRLNAGDFAGRWPSQTALGFEWRLEGGALHLRVEARNAGSDPLPIGLGWHPYFAIPSGRRAQARLRLPAALRAEVDNYDQVLPTGRLLPVAGGAYDFTAPGGRPLGDLYLDDCFTGLRREGGGALVELIDPAAGLGLRIASPSPQVKAIQVYAPPDKAFIAIEPQFNLPDPFGEVWARDVDTGMARLAPGEGLTYEVSVEPFAVEPP